ncbi:pro-cathepsin H-like [Protopterus annectens]|uniref:pro-cathepsin H-like n=1 Tax=Protopterus annectens TaxID=7888 RepID=UPI001CF94C72|nr:pro-cathepsin H-like [Protopterus annectens]
MCTYVILAIVGAIESRYCVKTNQLHTFSEQQLVDCDTTNKGCNITSKDIAYKHNQTQVVVMRGNSMKYIAVVGKTKSSLCAKYGQLYSLSEQQMAECEKLNKDFHGNRFKALKYIQNVGGLMKETDYPYKAVDGVCHYDEKLAVKISISEIKKIDADKIAYDVYKYGPTTFSMRVIDDFHLYKKGIYSPTSDCSKANGRHAMIIAGYDSGFWIVKNSWGSHWGEDGYVRIKRGVNVCRMENRVYSPYLQ